MQPNKPQTVFRLEFQIQDNNNWYRHGDYGTFDSARFYADRMKGCVAKARVIKIDALVEREWVP
jgi:hypothetical protein